MMPRIMSKLQSFLSTHSDLVFAVCLALIVFVMYAPSIHFGLIWDDPTWYQQGTGQSVWQIFTSLPSYQFYRPLGVLMNRALIASAGGLVNAPLAHLIQITAHLLTTLLSVSVLQAFDFEKWHARLASVVFAIFPLSYQAIAWAAPLQALTMLLLFISLVTANRFNRRKQTRFLFLSLLAYTFALLIQESAVSFVVLFIWLAFIHRNESTDRSRRGWPVWHLSLAAIYLFIWLHVPRAGGVIGQGFQPTVLGYLLQGIVFPFAGLLSIPLMNSPLIVLIALFALITLLLLLSLWKGHSLHQLLTIIAWLGAGLLPIWVGLSWKYVQLGSRLLYPSSLGIAALWSGLIIWLFTRQQFLSRHIAVSIGFTVVAVSISQWLSFQRLYAIGTQHLDQTISRLSDRANAELLFVNYPDRLELQPRTYPLGYWGLILAPVVENLSDFARAANGASAGDRSISDFLVGADQRAVYPYDVAVRGSDTDPSKIFEAALHSDAVYLTDYRSDGSLQLREVGSVRSSRSDQSGLATFGHSLQLSQADLSTGHDRSLKLTWRCLQPLDQNDTVFVHVSKDEQLWLSRL
jgi:hypothetical protein